MIRVRHENRAMVVYTKPKCTVFALYESGKLLKKFSLDMIISPTYPVPIEDVRSRFGHLAKICVYSGYLFYKIIVKEKEKVLKKFGMEKKWTCNVVGCSMKCSETSVGRMISRFIYTHLPVQLKCPNCQENFTSATRGTKHMRESCKSCRLQTASEVDVITRQHRNVDLGQLGLQEQLGDDNIEEVEL